MKQLERIRVTSSTAPQRMGSKNPPRPPASPTIPLTTPRFCGNSSLTYLNVEAMPNASTTPSTNSNPVNDSSPQPRWNVAGPSMVFTESSVGGYEIRNSAIHATHKTHHVTLCAPWRSDNQ